MLANGDAILLLHVACTLPLVGLIWVIQLVHYPAFDFVDLDRFIAFETMHRQRITFIVAPLMLGEGLTSMLLFVWRPPSISLAVVGLGALMTAALWISTAVVQAPFHVRLGRGYDPELVRRLILTNVFRTAAWSLRGLLVLWMMYTAWLPTA